MNSTTKVINDKNNYYSLPNNLHERSDICHNNSPVSKTYFGFDVIEQRDIIEHKNFNNLK